MTVSMESTEFESRGQFQTYLEALCTAKTDTEKFAALLVLSKCVKAGECTTNDREQILQALGFSFFIRLLRTKTVPEECSPLVYKLVALSVLSGLVEDRHIAGCPEMRKLAPHLKELMKTVCTKCTEERGGEEKKLVDQLQKDAYGIISRMACTPAGGQMLLDNEYQVMFVHILQEEPNEETVVKPLAMLILLQHQFGHTVWQNAVQAYHDLLAFLAHQIAICKDKAMFHLVELMEYIMRFAPETDRSPEVMTMAPLMEKVSSLLRSRIGVSQRQLVLILVNHLTLHLGVRCLHPPVVADKKLLSLVLNLTCIEVRIVVENFSAEEVLRDANKLCCYYNLLETLLCFLCHNDTDQDLPLKAAAFSQAHDALLHAFNGICYFLRQVDNGAMNIPLLDSVVLASVRMIAAISSQAFTEVKDHIILILPFLVKLGKLGLDMLKGSREADQIYTTNNTDSAIDGKSLVGTTVVGNDNAVKTSDTVMQKLDSLKLDSSPSHSVVQNVHNADVHSVSEVAQGDGSLSPGSSESNLQLRATDKIEQGDSVEKEIDVVVHCCTTSVSSTDSAHDRLSPENIPGRTGRGAEKDSMETSVDFTQEDQILPTNFEGLLKLIHQTEQRPGARLVNLHSTDIIGWLMPVFHFICTDEETRKVFLEEEGHVVLIEFLLQRRSAFFTDIDDAAMEKQVIECDMLEVLLQLLMLDEALGQTVDFNLLLEMVLNTVPEVGNTPNLFAYKGSLIASGLALTLALSRQHSSYVRNQREVTFMQSAVAHLCQVANAVARADVTILTGERWSNIRRTWITSLDLIKTFVTERTELIDMFLELKFIQSAGKILLPDSGCGLDEENIHILLEFLEALAQVDSRARNIFREHGFTNLTSKSVGICPESVQIAQQSGGRHL